MPTVPSTRPVIPDAALYNGAPDLASLTAQIMQALNYAYTRDMKWVPCDPCAWRSPADANFPMRAWVADVTSNSGAISCHTTNLGRLFIPESRSYARRLVFYVYCVLQGASDEATIDFVNERTGEVTHETISNAALGGSSGWLGPIYVPCRGPNTVKVTMTYVAGGNEKTQVHSLCGWWEPLDSVRADVTIDADAAWTTGGTPSQAYHANGVADHSYYLKWLVRRLQQKVGHSPLMVCAKWYGIKPTNPAGTAPRGVTASIAGTTTVGRYKIWVGDRVPSLRFAVYAFTSGTATSLNVDILVNGSSTGAFSAAGAWGWKGLFDSSTGLVKGAVNEITVNAVITNPTGSCTIDVGCVNIYENQPTATDLKLPGGETIPSAFPQLPDELVRSRQGLYADTNENGKKLGRKALIGAVLYVWANRVRHLVSDSRLFATSNGVSDTTGAEIGQLLWKPSPAAYNAHVLICGAIQLWGNASPAAAAAGQYAVHTGPNGTTENIAVDRLNALTDPGGDWFVGSTVSTVAGTEYTQTSTMVPNPGTTGNVSGALFGLAIEEEPIAAGSLGAL